MLGDEDDVGGNPVSTRWRDFCLTNSPENTTPPDPRIGSRGKEGTSDGREAKSSRDFAGDHLDGAPPRIRIRHVRRIRVRMTNGDERCPRAGPVHGRRVIALYIDVLLAIAAKQGVEVVVTVPPRRD